MSSPQVRKTLKGYQLVEDLGKRLQAYTEFDVSIFPKLNGDTAPQQYEIINHEELVLLAATVGSPIEVKGTQEEYMNGIARFSNLKNPICRAGCLNITLNPRGEVSPCLLFPKIVGSVQFNSIKEIWKNTVLNGNWCYSNNIKHENVKMEDLEECRKHKYCAYCLMCPGKAYLETGNPLLAAPSNCRIAKARCHAAELLSAGNSRDEIARLFKLPSNFGRLY